MVRAVEWEKDPEPVPVCAEMRQLERVRYRLGCERSLPVVDKRVSPRIWCQVLIGVSMWTFSKASNIMEISRQAGFCTYLLQ